jgi:hypothetical protein
MIINKSCVFQLLFTGQKQKKITQQKNQAALSVSFEFFRHSRAQNRKYSGEGEPFMTLVAGCFSPESKKRLAHKAKSL